MGAGSDLKHSEQVSRYENQMKCLLLFFSLGTRVCVWVCTCVPTRGHMHVCSQMWWPDDTEDHLDSSTSSFERGSVSQTQLPGLARL